MKGWADCPCFDCGGKVLVTDDAEVVEECSECGVSDFTDDELQEMRDTAEYGDPDPRETAGDITYHERKEEW